MSLSGAGSSPLTRGKPPATRSRRTPGRLIPAHAGKTERLEQCATTTTAHPRSRGENRGSPAAGATPCGSSPLTRGKRDRPPKPPTAPRLIPAHAGKTTATRPPPWPSPAHPRSRGENSDSQKLKNRPYGSSPLTRGKHARRRGGPSIRRLIPAHAGKTALAAAFIRATAAHPRSRGENDGGVDEGFAQLGSSPLTRGKRHPVVQVQAGVRLIPAHAGKTTVTATVTACSEAHPRSRGENPTRLPRGGRASGSSPLTRGKPHRLKNWQEVSRLIPAHAGKTAPGAKIQSWKPAHPRSRGENRSHVITKRWPAGSSPLTRGKLCLLVGEVAQNRLIPAHAGKTLPDLRFYRADRSDLGKP